MKDIITANVLNLNKLLELLSNLSESDYRNYSVLPYKSSIGNHTRHILDFYSCILEYDTQIDLTYRNRDCLSNFDISFARNRLTDTIKKINAVKLGEDFLINVYDDLGFGKTKVSYTYSSLLAYANSHTTHHYASIAYLLQQVNPNNDFLDATFGINTNALHTLK